MCCISLVVKYVLFLVNLAFSLLGLAIVGLGVATLVSLRDLNQILSVNILPIGIMVLGIIIFLISFLACCGAVRESQCMLLSYTTAVAVLTGLKIWLAVLLFSSLDDIRGTVDGWMQNTFENDDLRPAFHVLEYSFKCCGTTGPDSYITNSESLPLTCCQLPGGITIQDLESLDPDSFNTTDITQCIVEEAFVGCGIRVGSWLESFGEAVGTVLLIVIAIEIGAILFALFYCISIRNKRRNIY